MKIIIFILAILSFFISCSTPVVKQALPYSTEVECIENIKGNSYKYLAWGIGATNQEAEQDALKAAVYACLVTAGAGECNAMLDISEQEKNKDFIHKFLLDESLWMSFVVNTNRGRIDPGKRLKMDDGRIKLGIEVLVKTKELREFLQEKKVLQKTPYGL